MVGWLNEEKVYLMNRLMGSGWQSIYDERTIEEREWDKYISFILLHKKKHGHCKVRLVEF